MVPITTPCDRRLPAPPFPPTTISSDNIVVTNETISQQAGLLTLNVFWKPPVYLNGDLEMYEICIGEVVVGKMEECVSRTACVSAPNVDKTNVTCGVLEPDELNSPSVPIEYVVPPDAAEVVVQVCERKD